MLPTPISAYSLRDIDIAARHLKHRCRLIKHFQGKPLQIVKTQDLRPTLSFTYVVAEPEPVSEIDLNAISILSAVLEDRGVLRRMLDAISNSRAAPFFYFLCTSSSQSS
ncbi:hypothetical protein NLJ89_g697 [Agrocybe chaxingu]|uniref:Uncharacterized protein n=1 Tax=Agrocybe chaxingu TaxID=84603 RepID=A0A9W8N1K8_9AGAR|nr:hypothetical protein NLJ89_g697 [Agrocybe chaxingu]